MPSQVPAHLKVTVGRRIRVARGALGLTQKDLAFRVGIDPMSVSRWERGRVLPSLSSLAMVAEALERDVDWFYTEREAA